MGARQRAQKRGKDNPKAAKGSLKGFPQSQKKGSSSIEVPSPYSASRGNALQGWQSFAHSSSPNHHNGFSMSQEARNTERHVFGWGTTKLRGNAVAFVSAGHLQQDEIQKAAGDEVKTEEIGYATADVAQESSDPPVQHSSSNDVAGADGQSGTVASQHHVEVEAVAVQQELHPDLVSTTFNTLRARSSSLSSSGSEQIIFTGRSGPRLPSQNHSQEISKSQPQKNKPLASSSTQTETLQSIPIRSQPSATKPTFEASSGDGYRRSGRRGRKGHMRPCYISDEEEAIMQDYIANMVVDDSSDDAQDHKTSKPVRKNETFRFYDGAGEENAKVQIKKATNTQMAKIRDIEDLDQAMDWNSDDLELFDNMSTSDEEIGEVEQVLRQRKRESGLQYLITMKGAAVEDAKWILQSRLVSESALAEIRIFDEIQAMEFEGDIYDDDGDTTSNSEDDEALHDLVDNIESEDDENARILAHTSRMSDEQIARALAKQEELGMGADELLLFDGAADGDDADDLDDFGRGDDFISFSTKKHTSNRTRSKHNKKQRDSFPSASAFADALDEDPYGGFDIMDFDRPSLRPRKKGRKSDFPYDIDLEDEDLKDQLVSTWMKDREKKAQRKHEKEEARLAAAFDTSERSQPAFIKAEIRRFLCQDIEVLRLAPMDPATRASVHRLAKALRLNSKSEGVDGKGGGRHPVLTKTIRTPSYTINSIWEVDALLNTPKFFPKNPASYKSSKLVRGTITRTRRGGGGIQGATYMNGEVVGASAPELSADNKGRAMLEKMGWTSGMGIGAEGNKGGLEAIKHVVKTTKAGLG